MERQYYHLLFGRASGQQPMQLAYTAHRANDVGVHRVTYNDQYRRHWRRQLRAVLRNSTADNAWAGTSAAAHIAGSYRYRPYTSAWNRYYTLSAEMLRHAVAGSDVAHRSVG
jgi:hypothetical protein